MWNERFSAPEFVYGTAPNDFLAASAAAIPAGPVLSIGDGEGRNGVFLAAQGHAVTSLDASPVGLAKARRLAAERGVSIETVEADLAVYHIAEGAYAGIVSIFCHLPSALRRRVHAQVVAGLMPGGVFVLEAYTPAQLAFGTGGPKDADMLPTLEGLRAELPGLAFEHAEELEREVHEGTLHAGRSAVVQLIARRK